VSDNEDEVIEDIRSAMKVEIETKDEGLIVKADAIGSLEALAFELNEKGIPIKKAEVGDVSKRDVVEAATTPNPLMSVILAFNVEVLPDAKSEMKCSPASIFESSIIYKLIDDYGEWVEMRRLELDSEARLEIVYPGMFKILPECVFRVSKPAIVGVRVLAGRIRPGQAILRDDGRVVGRIKSIQSDNKSLKEAIQGQEVAISVEGVTIGRQLCVEDILYVDIPEGDCKKLNTCELNFDEKEVLDKICQIKRKEDSFWGM
jgi:translation initiation factor 5B